MKHLHATAIPVFLVSVASACATVSDPAQEARSKLASDLRKACIEAAGGTQMDAIDLYGGRLSAACSNWAYQQTRRTVR